MKFGDIFQEKNFDEIDLTNPDHRAILDWVRSWITTRHYGNVKLTKSLQKDIDKEIKVLNLNRKEVYHYYGDPDNPKDRKKIMDMLNIVD